MLHLFNLLHQFTLKLIPKIIAYKIKTPISFSINYFILISEDALQIILPQQGQTVYIVVTNIFRSYIENLIN